MMSGSIAQLFARSTFSADGQKVAASPGGRVDDDAISSERVRDFVTRLQVVVRGCVLPARLHLKNGGAQTVHVDDETGVGTGKGLKALLDLPEAVPVLGEDLAFELRALFVAPEGPNLRSRLGHGLLTGAEAWSAPTVYAWWLAPLLVVSSFWKVHRPAQPL